MPIFMDRHDVSKEVTAEHVAQLHHADLKIQHKYNCKGLTYWFDGERQTAFCLIEAPNKESLKAMHNRAHGKIPNRIIEVDPLVVESFLGRIEDPKKSKNVELNIINDPAFRTILIAQIKPVSLKNFSREAVMDRFSDYNNRVPEIIRRHNGNIYSHKFNYLLGSFNSVTKGVLCSLGIRAKFEEVMAEGKNPNLKLTIGVSAGVPVTEKEGFFEDTIRTAVRLCHVEKSTISISSEVRELYESENLNHSIDDKSISAFSPMDEDFLNHFIEYTEREWTNTTMNAEEISKNLGYSKSQLYRKVTSVTGKSPNRFIKDYRLEKALDLMHKKKDNINRIAFDTGFNSPAYFSKCFMESFGVLPSVYSHSL